MSFLNIAGLAVGLACFILIGLWVRDELSFDKFHVHKDRLFRIVNKTASGDLVSSQTYALTPALKALHPEIEEFSRVWFWSSSLVRIGDRRFKEDRIHLTDPGFFRMFTFPFVQGSPDTALADKRSVVLTRSTARRYFGGADPLGRTLHLDQFAADFTVSGVIEDVPSRSQFQFNLMARVELLGEDRLARWDEWTGPAYVLLRPGAAAAAIEAKIAGIYKEKVGPQETYVPILQPLEDVHLSAADGRSGQARIVALFSLIALLILVMACVNFMTLSTARAARRAKEIGMRKAIGARRPQIIAQFLGEAMITASISLVLAAILVESVLPSFNLFSGKSLTLFAKADGWTVLALFLTVAGTGFLAGSYPAFLLSSFRLVDALKSRFRAERRGLGIRKSLTVFQFAVSAGLIICTLVVAGQRRYIRTRDLGLNRDHIVILRNNPLLMGGFESFKNGLLAHPAVRRVTTAAQGPTWVGESIEIAWEGRQDEPLPVSYTVVDFDFFETFEMKIVQGRGFSREFPSDPREACVINETAAKQMGVENPVGMTISTNHPGWPEGFRKVRVIGVVADFHHRSLRDAIRPFVFRMYRPWHQYVFIKIDGARIPAALKAVETAFLAASGDVPFEYMFYDEAFNRQYASERQLGRLFGAFGGLSIFIACLGLFGLASFMAEQKTKEIGIRKVLGASVSSLIGLTVREFIKWVAAAQLVAWPAAAIVMAGWLREFAYRIHLGPGVFLGATALTLAVALLTVGIRAVGAALADPVDSLRDE